MNKKGFTLIELLAVIVILAIIALIATPIILNVIETAKKGSAESSALGYIDAVEKQIAINQVDSTKTAIPNDSYLVSDLKNTYGVDVKGDSPSDGWVLIEKGRVTDYSLKIGDYVVNPDSNKAKAEKNGTLKEKPAGGSTGPKYTVVDDKGTIGTVDVGDEIQVNGENFYVISNTNGKISALAKYNLNAGGEYDGSTWTAYTNPTYKQDSTMRGYESGQAVRKGTLKFSNDSGWPYSNNDDIDIQSYDGPVQTALNNYESVVTDATNVRLITKTELEGLGCNPAYYTCSGASDWVYSTSYWSGSAQSAASSGYVWGINLKGSIGFDGYFLFDYYYGVRPVIEIAA